VGVAVVIAACLAAVTSPLVPQTKAATHQAPPALLRFFQYDRPAQYDSIRHHVRVPMRDGVHLGCYLTQPAVKGTARPAQGRFPGIINNFSPYFIAYPVDAFHGDYFASRGYLDLQCLPRGTGTSDGVFPGWLSAIEMRDNYDLIEWLAHQPNASGKVGQHGNSYGGMAAYRVASLKPPALAAIAPQQAFRSLYAEYAYPGGIRSLGDPYWYLFAGAVGFVRPMVSPQLAQWALHPLLDGYWKQIDIDTKWDGIDIPVLGFGGWVDIFQDGMARNYMGLRGADTYLIEGPWEHSSTFDDTVTEGTLLAWYDRWLYGDTSAPLPPTHVASYRMPNGPWESLADWPLPGTGEQTLTLNGPNRLGPSPASPGHSSYVVNTAAGAVDAPGDHLVFTSAPLAVPMTIGGAPTLRLSATLTDPSNAAAGTPSLVDTNFVVHLYDIAPSGEQRLVTRGYLKASHRASHAHRVAIPLGNAVDYAVPLWHVHHRIAAGHRLSLVVRSGERNCCLSAAPALLQPLLPLRVSVATGAGGSTLHIPAANG
jgi:uncharacterized protein